MAADYGPRGIRVNAVALGLIEAALTKRLLENPTYRLLMLDGAPRVVRVSCDRAIVRTTHSTADAARNNPWPGLPTAAV